MENCLVTKLKGSVQNDKLPYFNHLVIDITDNPSNASLDLCVNNKKVSKLNIISGDGYLYKASAPDVHLQETTLVSNANTTTYFSLFKGKALLENKYDIVGIGNFSIGSEPMATPFNVGMNIEQLAYCPNLTHILFGLAPCYGNISALANCHSLLIFVIKGTIDSKKVSGDIASLKGLSNLRGISLLQNNVYGDIGELGVITSLVSIAIMDSNNAYTTIDTFIEKAKSKGRNSGHVSLYTNFYFGVTSGTMGSSWSLDWDGDFISLISTTKVYYMNATAEQIAEWRSAGKTTIIDASTGQSPA